MSTIRTDNIQSTDNSVNIPVAELASSSDLDDRVIYVGSVADLRASEDLSALDSVLVGGKFGGGSPGPGLLYRDPDDSTSPDDGSYTFVDASGNRWKKVYSPSDLSSCIDRRITSVIDGGGAPTPILDRYDDGEVIAMYRGNSTTHMPQAGGAPYIVRSMDDGMTWSDPELIISESGYDVRNYGGGIAPDGTLFLFYARWNDTSEAWETPAYVSSTDRGVTWSSPTLLSGATGGSPYGRFAVFDSAVVQIIYNTTGSLYSVRSTDGGDSWSVTEIFDQADADALQTGTKLTETWLEPTAGDNGIAVSRNNNHANAVMFTTTDAGATYSALGLTNIPMGNQPPTLYVENDWVRLFYPERIDPEKASQGEWTPVVQGSSVAGSHVYTNQTGFYYVTGQIVHCFFAITISTYDATASGDLQITGLPYTHWQGEAGVSLRRINGLDFPASVTQILAGSFPGVDPVITLRGVVDNAADVAIQASAGTNGLAITGNISYAIPPKMGNLAHSPNYYMAILHTSHFDDAAKWRYPSPLPIGLPSHGTDYDGNTVGDSGYANVVKCANGRPVLFYYKGAFDGNGVDLYASYLDAMSYV